MASKSPWMSRYLPLLDLMIQRSIQFSSFGPLVELLLRKKKKIGLETALTKCFSRPLR